MAKLLVIDDDERVSRLLKEHLTQEGHEVTIASMAQEGLAEAMKSSPDLILLDVMLPDATGFQACGRLRNEFKTRHTPIIMMSGAASSPGQQKLGRMMGANDYLVKPLNIIEVGDKVHELLAAPPPVPPPLPEAAVAPAVTEVTLIQHDIPNINLDRMFALMMDELKNS